MVIEDVAFKRNLKAAVRTSAPWMRDAAGVLFRLHSLALSGGMADLKTSDVDLLVACKAKILKIVGGMECSGHHLGAVYSQALAPWLCVSQGGGRGEEEMRDTVKDVGKAIVKNWKKHGKPSNTKREVRERIIRQYMEQARRRVWGGEDLVWNAFYK